MIFHLKTTISHFQGKHVRKLLLCILIVGVATGQRSVSNKRDCAKNEYWNNGLCCDKCTPGYKLIERCSIGVPSVCEKCSEGTYQDKMNYFPNCFRCKVCTRRSHAVLLSPCTPQNNTVCGCLPGYSKRIIDSISWDCVPNKRNNSVLNLISR